MSVYRSVSIPETFLAAQKTLIEGDPFVVPGWSEIPGWLATMDSPKIRKFKSDKVRRQKKREGKTDG